MDERKFQENREVVKLKNKMTCSLLRKREACRNGREKERRQSSLIKLLK